MSHSFENESLKADLKLPWLVVAVMVMSLVVYVVVSVSAGEIFRQHLPLAQRELIRTVLYVIGIISFPMTNLLRHIQLRLNQTMPGNKPAKSRYLLTVIVSMAMMETIGIFGFLMFLLGDDVNTLYIFTAMSALGMYLYRPKLAEYETVVAKLSEMKSA